MGKKIKGRERHIDVDVIGLMVGLFAHAADIQNRDAAPAVLASIHRSYPWLRHIFVSGGCQRPELCSALERIGEWRVEIVKRSDAVNGFNVVPLRWVVERTFAWLVRCRRLATDRVKSIASIEPRINVAHTRLRARRLAKYCYRYRVLSCVLGFLFGVQHR